MKYLSLIFLFLLTGCFETMPVKQKFPEVPVVLMDECPKLDTISRTQITLSEFLKIVNNNYKKYHECADAVKNWQDWYLKQKKLFDETNGN